MEVTVLRKRGSVCELLIVTAQKTVLFIVTAVRASDRISELKFIIGFVTPWKQWDGSVTKNTTT
jgi:hypothetical protein